MLWTDKKINCEYKICQFGIEYRFIKQKGFEAGPSIESSSLLIINSLIIQKILDGL